MILHQPTQSKLAQRFWRFFLPLIGITAIGILAHPLSAVAADKLVVTYGPLNATLAMADLETLVNTGEAPGSLRFYLNLAGLDPNVLRQVLTMELGASSNFMTEMLDSTSGQQLLTQISEVVHLPPNRPEIQVLKSSEQRYSDPSETENIAALKTALVEASGDRNVTVLEVLQHYPSEKVYVDAVKLIQFANSLQSPQSSQSSQSPEASQSPQSLQSP